MILTMKDLPEDFANDALVMKYCVPMHLAEVSALIRFRWGINGSCDGMYIINVIAYERKEGDGESHFYPNGPTEFAKDKNGKEYSTAEKSADYLIHAYGCNIPENDREELIKVITSGQLDVKQAIDGMHELKRFYHNMMKHDDPLRKDYHFNCMRKIDSNIKYLMALKTS